MLKILITVPSASFEFNGEAALPDVRPLIDQWYGVITDNNATVQTHVGELTSKIGAIGTTLDAVAQKLNTTGT